MRLSGLDYHGASLDIIASHAVIITDFYDENDTLNSKGLLIQGTVVKVQKVKRILILTKVL